MKGKKVDFMIKTVRDTKDIKMGIPKGSVIYVEQELKNHYIGLWAGQCFTLRVKVKKGNCKICK